MNERRGKARTDLDARLMIRRVDGSGINEVEINVTNVSSSGIGFLCKDELEMGVVYEGALTIWTKETLKVFLEVVRRQETEEGYNYGAHFVGMSDLYASKISVYQTVEENMIELE